MLIYKYTLRSCAQIKLRKKTEKDMLFQKSLAGLILVLASSFAYAIPIAGGTCGEPDRVAGLTGATYCAYGDGNFDVADINGFYGDGWTNVSELETMADDGTVFSLTDGYFSATADAGWGLIPNSGSWTIDATFWDMYDGAVISMHIGNAGEVSPDSWAWLIEDGATFGDWFVEYVSCETCTAGGLSNLKLWGIGGSTNVPEPGILWLLSAGLIAIGFARRKRS